MNDFGNTFIGEYNFNNLYSKLAVKNICLVLFRLG